MSDNPPSPPRSTHYDSPDRDHAFDLDAFDRNIERFTAPISSALVPVSQSISFPLNSSPSVTTLMAVSDVSVVGTSECPIELSDGDGDETLEYKSELTGGVKAEVTVFDDEEVVVDNDDDIIVEPATTTVALVSKRKCTGGRNYVPNKKCPYGGPTKSSTCF